MASLVELTEFLVRAIVREPDAVSVHNAERNGNPVLVINVDEQDRGAVIGRQGRTIKAIETVLDAASAGAERRPGLDVQTS
ncbi:MAG: KH domain-containing protein [Myxococcota bacterium]|nr:KH domain-containing protein [Myxococcota bacterium]